MGRPLKIKKTTTGANTGVDIGFNPFSVLTAPVVPVGFTPNSATEYQGVVGGSNTVDTATYPTVKCRVFIAGFAEEDGYIIRQKGSHKYLVGGTTERTALVVGRAYRITTVGNTAWASYGAGSDVAIGDVFTATAALANTGTGRVNAVGQCVLSSEADTALNSGDMNITYSLGDSTPTNISKLTNKFLQNFAGGAVGGNADTGDVWAAADTVDNVAFAANFFTDEGTTAKSGAEVDTWGANGSEQNAGGTLDLAIVEKYNS
jgi:predicted RNA binding protein YcfA (HicA-like mRNA interferase family)